MARGLPDWRWSWRRSGRCEGHSNTSGHAADSPQRLSRAGDAGRPWPGGFLNPCPLGKAYSPGRQTTPKALDLNPSRSVEGWQAQRSHPLPLLAVRTVCRNDDHPERSYQLDRDHDPGGASPDPGNRSKGVRDGAPFLIQLRQPRMGAQQSSSHGNRSNPIDSMRRRLQEHSPLEDLGPLFSPEPRGKGRSQRNPPTSTP